MDGKAHEKRILDTQKKNDKEEKLREKNVSVGFRDSNRKNASRMEKREKENNRRIEILCAIDKRKHPGFDAYPTFFSIPLSFKIFA